MKNKERRRIGRRRIRAFREKLRLGRAEFAVLCGVEHEDVVAWENGRPVSRAEEGILFLLMSSPAAVFQATIIFLEKIGARLGCEITITRSAPEPGTAPEIQDESHAD